MRRRMCWQEEDLAMIAAQQYYIEFYSEMNADRLLTLLPNYIPDYCLTNVDKSLDRWATLIHSAYKKVSRVKDKKKLPSATSYVRARNAT